MAAAHAGRRHGRHQRGEGPGGGPPGGEAGVLRQHLRGRHAPGPGAALQRRPAARASRSWRTTQPDKVAIFPIDQREGLYEFQARNVLIGIGVPSAELAGLAEMLVKLYKVARKSRRAPPRSTRWRCWPTASSWRWMPGWPWTTTPSSVIPSWASRWPGSSATRATRPGDGRPTWWSPRTTAAPSTSPRLQVDESGDGIWVGFHGAGGGGAMMAMDALSRGGLNAADFCDTSGNPPASKVYRAARIILAQPGIQGYFFAGSGVASQEQYHLARGLVKAFKEVGLLCAGGAALWRQQRGPGGGDREPARPPVARPHRGLYAQGRRGLSAPPA